MTGRDFEVARSIVRTVARLRKGYLVSLFFFYAFRTVFGMDPGLCSVSDL